MRHGLMAVPSFQAISKYNINNAEWHSIRYSSLARLNKSAEQNCQFVFKLVLSGRGLEFQGDEDE